MKRILIKCGGSILDELSSDFFDSLQVLKMEGYEMIIVHGGGPDINKMLDLLNVSPEYVDGLRKTDEKTFKVVEMVLSGETNRKLVKKLVHANFQAIGLNGSDAGLLKGDFINQEKLGFVGDVQKVNKELLNNLLKQNLLPVITPIAVTHEGIKLNVNADYAAAAVACALEVDHCLFVTDVEGIIIDGKMKKTLNYSTLEEQIQNGNIYGGMIPKVQSAIAAINKGLDSVRIVSGHKRVFHEKQWNGTEITKNLVNSTK